MGNSQSSLPRLPLDYHSDIETSSGKSSIYRMGELFVQKLTITPQSRQQIHAVMETLRTFTKQEKHLQKIHSLQLASILTCIRENAITVVCDYYSYTLKDLIGRRVGKSRISEEEIWYVLRSVAETGYFLQKRQLIIGDIRPDNLFISHDHQIKVPVVNIRGNFENSSYLQSFLCFRQGCLLSPEQLTQLKQGKKGSINLYKSDVYSLGMTLLQCCLKQDSSTRFYKYNQFTIHYNKILHSLEDLRGLYSNKLIEILGQMLCHDQHNRPDFRYLCGWLDTKGEKSNVSRLILDQNNDISVSMTTEGSQRGKKGRKNSKFSLRK